MPLLDMRRLLAISLDRWRLECLSHTHLQHRIDPEVPHRALFLMKLAVIGLRPAESSVWGSRLPEIITLVVTERHENKGYMSPIKVSIHPRFK